MFVILESDCVEGEVWVGRVGWEGMNSDYLYAEVSLRSYGIHFLEKRWGDIRIDGEFWSRSRKGHRALKIKKF